MIEIIKKVLSVYGLDLSNTNEKNAKRGEYYITPLRFPRFWDVDQTIEAHKQNMNSTTAEQLNELFGNNLTFEKVNETKPAQTEQTEPVYDPLEDLY